MDHEACGPQCLLFHVFLSGKNGSPPGIEAADLSRGPHQASESGTKSHQNKAGVTAKGGVFVGRGGSL